ncbi:DUF6624 domain-containing protein [Nonomuraea sp. AD125B]|uniref:DUF6624 domain-containing protein n=1 Tax=Nonomuraea sp. AD125B TaxID=3242897 RepID=UPI0035280454
MSCWRGTAFLKRVIDAHGWPGHDLVGERDAVARGQAAPRHLAYLVDRVRVGEGRPQVYGTQYRQTAEGGFGPHPVEDPGHPDERRAEVGIEPHAEYDRHMRRYEQG